MLTDAERAFLKGLRQGGVYKYLVYFDATGIAVEANRCEDISAEQVAALLVTAAHEYARFAEVIEAVKRVRGAYDAMMEKIQPPDERWQKLADEMQALQDIIYYRLPGDAEPKEAADAER